MTTTARRVFLKNLVQSSLAFRLGLGAGGALLGALESTAQSAAAAGSAKLPVIDIHPHIASTDTVKYPLAPVGGKRSDWSQERSISFEQLIAAMDEAGVSRAAIVHSSTTYGYDCSYVADCVAQMPRRVTGVFSVNLLADEGPAKIRYWAVERKLSGLRIFTSGDTVEKQAQWFTDARVAQCMAVAQELGLPVCVSLRPVVLEPFLTLVKKFPKLRFLVDHMMEPPIDEGPPYAGSQFLFDLAAIENIYLKFTTQNILALNKGKGTAETFMPLLVSKFGSARMAWGSNYPATAGSLKQMVEDARRAVAPLSSQDQERILAGTARGLYPVLAG